ncbi:hypothetical protein [Neptunomonas phycophila]|uniref:hypothetical protein n=1 Tax=Neptunomonas phycophila TaxID=1572645 RepID=UPI0037367526
MSNQACTQERFLNDVANHTLKVIKDDGLHRHLSFTQDGSSVYRFDLITWPGYLCICGDMGEYVFRRLPDMFEFFRMDKNDFMNKPDQKLSINPHYWSEKLQATPCNDSDRGSKFCFEEFESSVWSYFESHCEEPGTESYQNGDEFDQEGFDDAIEQHEEIKSDLKNALFLSEHDEYGAVALIRDFDSNDFRFEDWEGRDTVYRFHYLWCLYAIVWGVQQYDAAKNSEVAA